MFEPAAPQNNSNLAAEKGPACDIRHRFSLSGVYELHTLDRGSVAKALTRNWQVSAIYQAQTGFPFTVSVFGDTANAGTVLGENPVRANATGQPVFGQNTKRPEAWFNPAAFSTPAAYTFGNAGRNTVYGPGLQSLDVAVSRSFALRDQARLTFRLEAFNSLNRVNLGTPNRFVNTAQFGTITESSTPGRVLQISARLNL